MSRDNSLGQGSLYKLFFFLLCHLEHRFHLVISNFARCPPRHSPYSQLQVINASSSPHPYLCCLSVKISEQKLVSREKLCNCGRGLGFCSPLRNSSYSQGQVALTSPMPRMVLEWGSVWGRRYPGPVGLRCGPQALRVSVTRQHVRNVASQVPWPT